VTHEGAIYPVLDP